MRKWYILLMTAVGMTLLMLLGYGDPTLQQTRKPDGGASPRDSGGVMEATQERIAIEAVVSIDRDAFASLAQATARYETMRPNVEVSLTNVPEEDLYIRYRSLTETGEAPDVLLYPTMWVRHEAAEGRLLALDDYISVERQSQWFEAVRGAVRWNGYLWGVPVDWDPFVFVFRADAADEVEAAGSAIAWIEAEGFAPTGDRLDGYGAAVLQQLVGLERGEGAPDRTEDAGATAEGEDEAPPFESGDAALAPAEEEDVPAVGTVDASGKESAFVSLLSDDSDAAPAAHVGAASGEALALEGSFNSSFGSAEAVKDGRAKWAFVPLSEAVSATEGGEEDTLRIAAPIVEGKPGGPLPPFLGSSYVVSPSTSHPAEAAEWIRYVTEETPATAAPVGEGMRWPVQRTMYGLSSAGNGETTILPLSTAPERDPTPEDWMGPLPGAVDPGAEALWPSFRSVMRLLDRMSSQYGAPPAELPYYGVP